MSWINKKTGQINWDECERCLDCKALTDHKTGFCMSCRDKRGLIKKIKPSVTKRKQEAEARKYLK